MNNFTICKFYIKKKRINNNKFYPRIILSTTLYCKAPPLCLDLKRKQALSWGQFHRWFWAPTPNFRTLHPTFEKLFTVAKVQRKVQKFGVESKTVYEIDPWSKHSLVILLPKFEVTSHFRFFKFFNFNRTSKIF